VKVLWSASAVGHLAAIREYISQTSPFYAERMIQRILDRAPQLIAFPESGKRVREVDRPDIREVLEGPFRVIYQVSPDHVSILAVVHGRRGSLGIDPAAPPQPG
jgi:plasmid stabilization system protein ParE